MARKGDGIYKRGKTWRLDIVIHGKRHQLTLGKNISRSVAAELAQIERAKILRGEAGIGRKPRDITFDKAAADFLKASEANTRPNTIRGYRQHLDALAETFGQRKLSEISPFLIEKHKARRVSEAPVRGRHGSAPRGKSRQPQPPRLLICDAADLKAEAGLVELAYTEENAS